MLRRYERGQAVFETAIFLPLFLLSLFGMFVAVTQGAMSERVQMSMRYGAVISAAHNSYIQESLYELYATIDGQNASPQTSTCTANTAVGPALTVLTDPSRHTFWQPKAGSVVATCNSNGTGLRQTGGTGTGNFFPPYTANDQNIGLSAQVPVPSYLANLGGVTGATENDSYQYESTSTVGQDLNCGPIGGAVKDSLEAGTPGQQVNLNYYAGTGYGGSWIGSIASPLPSAAPFLGTDEYFSCGQTFGPQVVQTPAPN